MKKVVHIEICAECPFFEYRELRYISICTKKNIEIPTDAELNSIPKWCPLPDYDDTITKTTKANS